MGNLPTSDVMKLQSFASSSGASPPTNDSSNRTSRATGQPIDSPVRRTPDRWSEPVASGNCYCDSEAWHAPTPRQYEEDMKPNTSEQPSSITNACLHQISNRNHSVTTISPSGGVSINISLNCSSSSATHRSRRSSTADVAFSDAGEAVNLGGYPYESSSIDFLLSPSPSSFNFDGNAVNCSIRSHDRSSVGESIVFNAHSVKSSINSFGELSSFNSNNNSVSLNGNEHSSFISRFREIYMRNGPKYRRVSPPGSFQKTDVQSSSSDPPVNMEFVDCSKFCGNPDIFLEKGSNIYQKRSPFFFQSDPEPSQSSQLVCTTSSDSNNSKLDALLEDDAVTTAFPVQSNLSPSNVISSIGYGVDLVNTQRFLQSSKKLSQKKNSSGITAIPPTSSRVKESQTVEFYVRNFWKTAKTQNDLESPTEGYCRGFVYRLLLHPRGTTGTDSESSHLSVFLEAVRQDWYPEDWVFPNVRFELTVVNFRDPKQSVTSWAHWSFSNEATSRGWQKMISHTRLTKQAGFMDDDGSVLVKGKAEPPYPTLWSRGPVYRPRRMWEYIPDRSTKALEESSLFGVSCRANNVTTSNCDSNSSSISKLHPERNDNTINSLLAYAEPLVPALEASLNADYVALFIHCLYHIREFRKQIFLWNANSSQCNSNDEQTHSWNNFTSKHCNLIAGLQRTFASMQLWPIVVMCKQLQKKQIDCSSKPGCDVHVPALRHCQGDIWKWYASELFPKNCSHRRVAPPPSLSNRLGFCTLCKRCTCCCRCSSSAFHIAAGGANDTANSIVNLAPSFSGGCQSPRATGFVDEPTVLQLQLKLDKDTCLCCDLKDRYPELMNDIAPPPNIKPILKALHLHDLQKMDTPDPLVKFHVEFFSMLMRELAKAKIYSRESHDSFNASSGISDVADLENTCRMLFSSSDSQEGLFHLEGVTDFSAGYIRCKHVHSLQKALEACGKVLHKYPEVLFIYLHAVKNSKKGELFDVPLRLDVHKLLHNQTCSNFEPNKSINFSVNEREKNRKKLRKKMLQSRKGNKLSKDELEDGTCFTDDEDEESDDDDEVVSIKKDRICGQEKWYSLYSLFMREGDSKGDGFGSLTSHYLLLRPEEDGPWFRIGDNRVERLVSKVEFTEWKCHRDFFCAGAVYVAEDYIDAIQAGEIDLSGDLKSLNSDLYYRTLADLGITEEEIMNPKLFGSERTDNLAEENSQFNAISIPNDSRSACNFFCNKNNYSFVECCPVHGYSVEQLNGLQKLDEEANILESDKHVASRMMQYEILYPVVSWIFQVTQEKAMLMAHSTIVDKYYWYYRHLQRCENKLKMELRHAIFEVLFEEWLSKHLSLFNIEVSCCTDIALDQWNLDKQDCQHCLGDAGRLLVEQLGAVVNEPVKNLVDKIFSIKQEIEAFCRESRIRSIIFQKAQEIPSTDPLASASLMNIMSCASFNSPDNIGRRRPRSVSDGIINPSTSSYVVKTQFLDDCFTKLSHVLLPVNTSLSELQQTIVDRIYDFWGYCATCMNQIDLLLTEYTQQRSTVEDIKCIDYNNINGWHLKNSTEDYNDSKWNISCENTIAALNLLHNTFYLPNIRTMRNVLRQHRHFTFRYTRPHEIYRGYLELTKPEVDIVEFLRKNNLDFKWCESLFNIENTSEIMEDDCISNELKLQLMGEKSKLPVAVTEVIVKTLVYMLECQRQFRPKRAEEVYTAKDMAKLISAVQNDCPLLNFPISICVSGCTCDVKDFICNTPQPNDIFLFMNSENVGNVTADETSDKAKLDKFSESNCDSVAFSANPKTMKLYPTPISSVLNSKTKKKGKGVPAVGGGEAIDFVPPLDRVSSGLQFDQIIASNLDSDVFVSCLPPPPLILETRLDRKAAIDQWREYKRIRHKCIEIGLLVADDIKFIEGFGVDEQLVIKRRLLVRKTESNSSLPISVERLYWSFRTLLHSQLDESTPDYVNLEGNKKNRTKCKESWVVAPEREYCWIGTPRDAFLLYALRPDPDPTRKSRKRFVYMDPNDDLEAYMDHKNQLADTFAPDISILLMGAPQRRIDDNISHMFFPLENDSEFPLLIFKWFCHERVDLICMGALVCDSKQPLQNYIMHWLLPIVREKQYLSQLDAKIREDPEKFLVLEECNICTVQNIRRWSCAIRKINKKAGDIIIVQLKRTIDSPASIRFTETPALLDKVKELEDLDEIENNNKSHLFTAHSGEKDHMDSHSDQIQLDLLFSGTSETFFNSGMESQNSNKKRRKPKKPILRATIPCNKKSTIARLADHQRREEAEAEKLLVEKESVLSEIVSSKNLNFSNSFIDTVDEKVTKNDTVEPIQLNGVSESHKNCKKVNVVKEDTINSNALSKNTDSNSTGKLSKKNLIPTTNPVALPISNSKSKKSSDSIASEKSNPNLITMESHDIKRKDIASKIEENSLNIKTKMISDPISVNKTTEVIVNNPDSGYLRNKKLDIKHASKREEPFSSTSTSKEPSITNRDGITNNSQIPTESHNLSDTSNIISKISIQEVELSECIKVVFSEEILSLLRDFLNKSISSKPIDDVSSIAERIFDEAVKYILKRNSVSGIRDVEDWIISCDAATEVADALETSLTLFTPSQRLVFVKKIQELFETNLNIMFPDSAFMSEKSIENIRSDQHRCSFGDVVTSKHISNDEVEGNKRLLAFANTLLAHHRATIELLAFLSVSKGSQIVTRKALNRLSSLQLDGDSLMGYAKITYMWFILGPRHLGKLADSQAGRRYVEQLTRKFSDFFTQKVNKTVLNATASSMNSTDLLIWAIGVLLKMLYNSKISQSIFPKQIVMPSIIHSIYHPNLSSKLANLNQNSQFSQSTHSNWSEISQLKIDPGRSISSNIGDANIVLSGDKKLSMKQGDLNRQYATCRSDSRASKGNVSASTKGISNAVGISMKSSFVSSLGLSKVNNSDQYAKTFTESSNSECSRRYIAKSSIKSDYSAQTSDYGAIPYNYRSVGNQNSFKGRNTTYSNSSVSSSNLLMSSTLEQKNSNDKEGSMVSRIPDYPLFEGNEMQEIFLKDELEDSWSNIQFRNNDNDDAIEGKIDFPSSKIGKKSMENRIHFETADGKPHSYAEATMTSSGQATSYSFTLPMSPKSSKTISTKYVSDFNTTTNVVSSSMVNEKSFANSGEYDSSNINLPNIKIDAIDEREDDDDVTEDYDSVPAHRLFGETSLYDFGKPLSRRTFSKDFPYVVDEGYSWMVLYKPAFWHCSGPGRDRKVHLPKIATTVEVEASLAHISLDDMVNSGKIESFHLYVMKKYPRMETVRRWYEMECGLCHRIDLETSGSLLIAKTRRARELIFEQFRKRFIHKEYLLLCHGRLERLYDTIDEPIATRDYDNNRSKSHFSEVVGIDEGGEEALTEYQLLKVFRIKSSSEQLYNSAKFSSNICTSNSEFCESTRSNRLCDTPSIIKPDEKNVISSKNENFVSDTTSNQSESREQAYTNEFSFCKVRIHTGRTHQIRVHFRHIGHPLVGDTKYTDPNLCITDRAWCPRMFLHSSILEFENPDTAETKHVHVRCPLATELQAVLDHEMILLEDYSNITLDMIGKDGKLNPKFEGEVIRYNVSNAGSVNIDSSKMTNQFTPSNLEISPKTSSRSEFNKCITPCLRPVVSFPVIKSVSVANESYVVPIEDESCSLNMPESTTEFFPSLRINVSNKSFKSNTCEILEKTKNQCCYEELWDNHSNWSYRAYSSHLVNIMKYISVKEEESGLLILLDNIVKHESSLKQHEDILAFKASENQKLILRLMRPREYLLLTIRKHLIQAIYLCGQKHFVASDLFGVKKNVTCKAIIFNTKTAFINEPESFMERHPILTRSSITAFATYAWKQVLEVVCNYFPRDFTFDWNSSNQMFIIALLKENEDVSSGIINLWVALNVLSNALYDYAVFEDFHRLRLAVLNIPVHSDQHVRCTASLWRMRQENKYDSMDLGEGVKSISINDSLMLPHRNQYIRSFSPADLGRNLWDPWIWDYNPEQHHFDAQPISQHMFLWDEERVDQASGNAELREDEVKELLDLSFMVNNTPLTRNPLSFPKVDLRGQSINQTNNSSEYSKFTVPFSGCESNLASNVSSTGATFFMGSNLENEQIAQKVMCDMGLHENEKANGHKQPCNQGIMSKVTECDTSLPYGSNIKVKGNLLDSNWCKVEIPNPPSAAPPHPDIMLLHQRASLSNPCFSHSSPKTVEDKRSLIVNRPNPSPIPNTPVPPCQIHPSLRNQLPCFNLLPEISVNNSSHIQQAQLLPDAFSSFNVTRMNNGVPLQSTYQNPVRLMSEPFMSSIPISASRKNDLKIPVISNMCDNPGLSYISPWENMPSNIPTGVNSTTDLFDNNPQRAIHFPNTINSLSNNIGIQQRLPHVSDGISPTGLHHALNSTASLCDGYTPNGPLYPGQSQYAAQPFHGHGPMVSSHSDSRFRHSVSFDDRFNNTR